MKKAISRRDFLKVVGVSAAALGMTACGGSSASTSTSTAASNAASSTASSAAAGAGEGGSGNDYKLTWNEVNGEDYGATVGAHTFAEKKRCRGRYPEYPSGCPAWTQPRNPACR